MRGDTINGYPGKIAWVDLTSGSARTEELSEEIPRKYLGGKGFGAYLPFNHLKPRTDPYDPSNLLIFVTGPLTGTPFPCVVSTLWDSTGFEISWKTFSHILKIELKELLERIEDQSKLTNPRGLKYVLYRQGITGLEIILVGVRCKKNSY